MLWQVYGSRAYRIGTESLPAPRGRGTRGMVGAGQGSLGGGSQAESWRWSCSSHTLLAGSGWLKPPLPLEMLVLGKACLGPHPHEQQMRFIALITAKSGGRGPGHVQGSLRAPGKAGESLQRVSLHTPREQVLCELLSEACQKRPPREVRQHARSPAISSQGLWGSSWQGQSRACAVACGMWTEDSG